MQASKAFERKVIKAAKRNGATKSPSVESAYETVEDVQKYMGSFNKSMRYASLLLKNLGHPEIASKCAAPAQQFAALEFELKKIMMDISKLK